MARRVKKMDNLFWGVATGFFAGQSAGPAALNFITTPTLPATLLRLRGEVICYLDGAGASSELIRVHMGIILVPEGSGTTVVYDPHLDPNAPWLYHQIVHLGYEERVTDVVDSPVTSAARYVIDNKAMRRIRPDVEAQFCMTNETVGGAEAVNVVYGIRVLQGH